MTEKPQPRIAVVVFPGSNDDRDAALALTGLGAEPVLVWHAEPELPDVTAVVLPGGFSYGDYLRCGAIGRFAPVMDAVRVPPSAWITSQSSVIVRSPKSVVLITARKLRPMRR